MAQIKITYEEIKSAASELGKTSNEMNDTFNEIVSVINSIFPEVWDGDAASSYKEGLDKVIAKFPEFVTAVQNEKGFLETAAANMSNVDKASIDVAL